MAPSDLIAARQQADDIAAFQRELANLERQSVLTLDPTRHAAVAAHHDHLLAHLHQRFDIDRTPADRQLSAGMRLASFVGAMALAAGVFFLFHQVWDRFPTALQVVTLVGAALGAVVMTLVVDRRDPTGHFTRLAAMVAFACFMANVVILQRIFNVPLTLNSLLPGTALAFLLAYAFGLRLLLATGIVCLIVFAAVRTATLSGTGWANLVPRPENLIPLGIGLLLVPLIASHARFLGFAATWRVFGLCTLFLPMLVLAYAGALSYLPFTPSLIEGIFQALGLTGTAGAVWVGIRRAWSEVTFTGVIFFVAFFYCKLLEAWWSLMPPYLLFLSMGMAAFVLLSMFKRLRRAAS